MNEEHTKKQALEGIEATRKTVASIEEYVKKGDWVNAAGACQHLGIQAQAGLMACSIAARQHAELN